MVAKTNVIIPINKLSKKNTLTTSLVLAPIARSIPILSVLSSIIQIIIFYQYLS